MSPMLLVPSQVVVSSNIDASKPPAITHRNPSDQTSSAYLIPSQVKTQRATKQYRHSSSKTREAQTTTQLWSTSKFSHVDATTAGSNKPTSNCTTNIAGRKQQNRQHNRTKNITGNHRLRRNSKKHAKKHGAGNQTMSKKKNQKKTRKRSNSPTTRFGNLPDIEWGSVPMDHLRQHPSFVSLPLPEELPPLNCVEDVRYIRQDSWQWDALHEGRCTTSQAVGALGFLEPHASKLLGIPNSWQQRGGSGAYHRLRKPALRTLEDMNTILLPNSDRESQGLLQESSSGLKSTKGIWRETQKKKTSTTGDDLQRSNNPPFAAEYLVKSSKKDQQSRRQQAIICANAGMSIRMMWGNAQEATSVLTALNYLTHQNPDIVVKEIGMCGAGLSFNQSLKTSDALLPIGATPDAIIEYPDGREEALEVKNHCPFVIANWSSKKLSSKKKKKFGIRELPFKEPYIFPLYIPQLMLEMLCVGPHCQSAIMVRQTATAGALMIRIHRNDAWIDEMLYWLQRFHQDFVASEQEPPLDFFWNSDDKDNAKRYRAFLERTKDISINHVEVVARIPHNSIQRANPSDPMFLD